MLSVTFYSFRGGVGRTMALANVAAHLARQGQRVFLIDFDLEAPGLSMMPEFQAQTPPESSAGLLGYLLEGLADRPLPPIRSLCYEPKLAGQLSRSQSERGDIHILPADARTGLERQYDLSRLHLEGLYETEGRSLIIDALKVQIAEEFSPDYPLIDSRTGLTDVGGICTVHLADLLVVVSGLNEQNVQGTCLAVERLHRARTDFADQVLFVFSPVPLGEEALKAQRLADARRRFADAMQAGEDWSQELLTVPYHPQLALSERSFVFHHPQSPITAAFRRIAERIRAYNPADRQTRKKQLFKRLDTGDPQAMRDLFEWAAISSAPKPIRQRAAMLYLNRQDYENARRLLEELVGEDPQDHHSLFGLANTLDEQAKTKSEAEADELFELAEKKLLAVEHSSPGSGAYDLACLAALRGRPDVCRQWLERSQEAGRLPSDCHLSEDPDLQSVRNLSWFKALLGDRAKGH